MMLVETELEDFQRLVTRQRDEPLNGYLFEDLESKLVGDSIETKNAPHRREKVRSVGFKAENEKRRA